MFCVLFRMQSFGVSKNYLSGNHGVIMNSQFVCVNRGEAFGGWENEVYTLLFVACTLCVFILYVACKEG